MTTESDSPKDTSHQGAAALEAIRAELDQLDERKVPNYNLDAVHASSTVYAAVERTQPFMAYIAAMPTLQAGPVQRLSTYAHALLQAHAMVLAHSPATSTFDSDAVGARAKRELMLLIADVLVARGLVAKKTVDDIRAGSGNRDLINDVIALHELLRPYAGGSISVEELAEIATLADRLSHSLAQRNGDDPELAPLLAQRKKVAALLVNAYRDLSAAMAFLRRVELDGSDFTPTIYVTGARSKSDSSAAENPASPKPSPVAPAKPASPAKPSDPREPSDNPFDDKS